MKTNNYLLFSAMLCGILSLNSCSDYETPANDASSKQNEAELSKDVVFNPDDEMLTETALQGHKEGFVYISGNEPGTNYIHVYRQPSAGNLTYLTKVASGGTGNGMTTGARGGIAVDKKNNLMYIVNPGDNSISSFQILSDGVPKLITTVRSEGIMPVSLVAADGKLYVAHSGSSSITGFRTDLSGNMVYIEDSSRKLSTVGAGPTQIALSPRGNYLYVSEAMTNKISAYRISATGRPGVRTTITTTGNTPGGIAFSHSKFMIVPNGEFGSGSASTASSYSGLSNGNVSDVNGAIGSQQTGARAIQSTSTGFYSFVVNNGSDNLSSYYTRVDGNIALAESSLPTGDGPIDMTIASNDISMYVLCENDDSLHSYLRAKGGNVIHTGKTLNHARSATGIASW